MPKPSGLFDSFDNIDQIPPELVARWIKPVPQMIFLENYIANKILYPQSIPISADDLKIERALLREALRSTSPVKQDKNTALVGNPFLNINLRKILIPSSFLNFIPDLSDLVWAFVDGLLLERKKENAFSDLWTVVLSSESEEILGSVLLPEFENKKGYVQINITGKNFKILAGSLTVVPCPLHKCEISLKFNQGKILGKQDLAIEVYGGKLGLMIDGRREF